MARVVAATASSRNLAFVRWRMGTSRSRLLGERQDLVQAGDGQGPPSDPMDTAHGELAARRGGAQVRGQNSIGAGGAEEGDAPEVAAHIRVCVERLGQRDVQQ